MDLAAAMISTSLTGPCAIARNRGRFNALPAPQDLEILRRWATEQRLQVSARVLGR